ncbi:hypothetical protein HDU79_000761 [Rhizoclosmatium sp. JEL0117]|nr:hypothetical protein HDU79_000761 [Rhizoclosmatium sp. JEL0117]
MFKFKKDALTVASSSAPSTSVDVVGRDEPNTGGGHLLNPLGSRFRSRTEVKENQVGNSSLCEPQKESRSGSALPVPSNHQRPASEGSTRAPSPEEQEAFVTVVREKLKSHPYISSLTDLEIKRFLISHRNISANALKQVQATLEWRQSFNFNSILTEDFSDLEATGKLVIDSVDYQQNAIMIWQQHRHVPLPASSVTAAASSNIGTTSASSSSSTPSAQLREPSKKEKKEELSAALQASIERNLRFFVYTIERAKQTHRLRSDNKLIVIIDRIGMTPANYDQPLGKAIVSVMPHYPELFESYYVFPKNAMLMVAWKVTRVFLDPVTVARIKLLGEAEVPSVLGDIMDKRELLVRYGGEKVEGIAEQTGSSGGCVIGTGADSAAGDLVVDDVDDDDDEFVDADEAK